MIMQVDTKPDARSTVFAHPKARQSTTKRRRLAPQTHMATTSNTPEIGEFAPTSTLGDG